MQKRKHTVGKTRRKRSAIWLSLSDKDFALLVAKSRHMGDVLNAFNLENVGRNHYTAKNRIDALGLNISHFNPRNRTYKLHEQSLEKLLVDNCNYSRCSLKKRLLSTNTLINKCAICGQLPVWNQVKLVMVLDHINGKRNDNRLFNLRLLCPNCNSQQPTFAGRNCKKK